jgi:hypothetical protein
VPKDYYLQRFAGLGEDARLQKQFNTVDLRGTAPSALKE